MIKKPKNTKKLFSKYSTVLSIEKLEKLKMAFAQKHDFTGVWLPGVGRSTFARLLADDPEFRQYLGVLDWKFITLNASLNDFFFQKQLEERLDCVGGSVVKAIEGLQSKHAQVYFLLDNFASENIDRIEYIQSLAADFPERVHMFNLSAEFELLKPGHNLKLNTTAMHNLQFFGYFTDDEAKEWLKINAKKHEIDLSVKEIAFIGDYAGGCPALMRCFLRQLPTLGKVEQIVDSPEMAAIKANLFGRLEELQPDLRKVQSGGIERVSDVVRKFLLEANLLETGNQQLTLRGKWLREMLLPKDKQLVTFDPSLGEMRVNDLEVMEHLSGKYQQILRLIVEDSSLGEVTLREKIARLVWGEKNEITEWAFDQQMARFKGKLKQLGLDRFVISRRGRGYEINRELYKLRKVS